MSAGHPGWLFLGQCLGMAGLWLTPATSPGPSHLPWPQSPSLNPATSPDTSPGLLDLAEEVADWGGTMATAPSVSGTVFATGFDTVPMNCNVTDSVQIVPPRV